MENRLKDKMDGLNYKPSDSLWNHIQEDLKGDFEKNLESRLLKYEVNPDPALWTKIEAELPIHQPAKPFNKVWLLGLSFLFSATAVALLFLSKKLDNL